ncbi:major facilitator superfamily domain-containing protein [Aspergillus alliaceus]|uniref:major facilitator superfamily domain-containing protein n=1 Tax=Petromyces alliaceus TaxID=209559 RepID=UPI0012A6A9F6|nr:major facilitator superfamily domain-containing protein [Aspergillus alliaceus]KAB8233206.1 major facilitator superfamily domain-containing protein [Aspergillus alliaceus]
MTMKLDSQREARDNDQGEGDQQGISNETQLEQLGRQRPAIFANNLIEIGFCFSLLTSMLLAEYFISGFNTILPVLTGALDMPQEAKTWPASVFSLVTGALLLPSARLADIYGAHIVFNTGLLWFFVWSLIGGCGRNYIMLILCRALQGLGPAAYLPAGIMLLGTIYRPGPRKNLVFSMYGAFSPIGFYSGISVSGVCGHYLSWRWYFWTGAIMLFVVSIISILSLPSTKSPSQSKMDWWGCSTIIPGLLLTVYAITDGAHAPNGWRNPYILVTFILGIILLCAAFYVEGWIATSPLLPFDLFKVKYMTPLIVSLLFSYGVFGIYLFYVSFYIENVIGKSSLTTAVWFAPMAAGGLILATVGGFTLHFLPGKLLLMISGAGYLVSVLLFARIPENPNYWAYVFPAMVGTTVGCDIAYSVSNIFITTNLPKDRQGVAGAVINSTVFLGISFFLGIADLTVSETAYLGLKGSYKAAFWFGVACAVVALIFLSFIKIGKAESELTVEERGQLKASRADAEA